jgi:ADP-ribose pyrophosphatase YjhB (NUDIX family)
VETTWDGVPIAEENPRGCSIVVWRGSDRGREFLILHRRAAGPPEFEGNWAWTPPAGSRQPGEDISATVVRELREETGLELECAPTTLGTDEWLVYLAEAPQDANVVLDTEHDRLVWLPSSEASRAMPARRSRSDDRRRRTAHPKRLSCGTSGRVRV